jgi:uncharacterized membrane protein
MSHIDILIFAAAVETENTAASATATAEASCDVVKFTLHEKNKTNRNSFDNCSAKHNIISYLLM